MHYRLSSFQVEDEKYTGKLKVQSIRGSTKFMTRIDKVAQAIWLLVF